MNRKSPLYRLVCRFYRRLSVRYLEDTLPPARRSAMSQHLMDCGECRQEIRDLQKVIGSVREAATPAPLPASDLWQRLEGKLQASHSRQPAPPVHRSRRVYPVLGSSILAVGAALVFVLRWGPGSMVGNQSESSHLAFGGDQSGPARVAFGGDQSGPARVEMAGVSRPSSDSLAGTPRSSGSPLNEKKMIPDEKTAAWSPSVVLRPSLAANDIAVFDRPGRSLARRSQNQPVVVSNYGFTPGLSTPVSRSDREFFNSPTPRPNHTIAFALLDSIGPKEPGGSGGAVSGSPDFSDAAAWRNTTGLQPATRTRRLALEESRNFGERSNESLSQMTAAEKGAQDIEARSVLSISAGTGPKPAARPRFDAIHAAKPVPRFLHGGVAALANRNGIQSGGMFSPPVASFSTTPGEPGNVVEESLLRLNAKSDARLGAVDVNAERVERSGPDVMIALLPDSDQVVSDVIEAGDTLKPERAGTVLDQKNRMEDLTATLSQSSQDLLIVEQKSAATSARDSVSSHSSAADSVPFFSQVQTVDANGTPRATSQVWGQWAPSGSIVFASAHSTGTSIDSSSSGSPGPLVDSSSSSSPGSTEAIP